MIAPEIGAALRAARIAAGIGQRELAERMGISPFALNRAELGIHALPEAWLDLLPEPLLRTVAAAIVEHHRREAARIERMYGK